MTAILVQNLRPRALVRQPFPRKTYGTNRRDRVAMRRFVLRFCFIVWKLANDPIKRDKLAVFSMFLPNTNVVRNQDSYQSHGWE